MSKLRSLDIVNSDWLSEITVLFNLNLDLDRTLAQQKAEQKLVTHCDWLVHSVTVVSN